MHMLDGQISSCTYDGLSSIAVSSIIKEDGSHGACVDAAQYICMLLFLNALHGCQSCLQKVTVKLGSIVREGVFWWSYLCADVGCLHVLQLLQRQAKPCIILLQIEDSAAAQ